MTKKRRGSKDHLIIDDAKAALSEVKGVIGAIAPGGVKDDRYNATKDKVIAMGKKYGYMNATNGSPSLAAFKATAKDAPDKAKTMEPMFRRLDDYVYALLEFYNPGLGQKFRAESPMQMANLGNLTPEYIPNLETLMSLYAPGTYRPTFKEQATTNMNATLNNQPQTTATVSQAEKNKQNLVLLSAVRPVMEAGLRQNGSVPPSDLTSLSDQFYNEIVVPGTNAYESDNLDDAVTNAILSFVATLAAKKQAGVPMNPVYEKIATATEKVKEKVEEQVKTQSGNALGNWIIDNPVASVLIVIVVGLILAKLFKVI